MTRAPQVLEGEVELLIGDGSNRIVRVPAGKAFVLPAKLRVQWRWRGPRKYVPICLPAFSRAFDVDAEERCGDAQPASEQRGAWTCGCSS